MINKIDRTSVEALYQNFKATGDLLAASEKIAGRVTTAIMGVGVIVSLIVFMALIFGAPALMVNIVAGSAEFTSDSPSALGVFTFLGTLAVAIVLAMFAFYWIMVFAMNQAERFRSYYIRDAYWANVNADLAHQEAIGQW